MKVTLEELLEFYQEHNVDDLCRGCDQQGEILFPADEYQEAESVCRECMLEKLEDNEEFQMCRYYNGGE